MHNWLLPEYIEDVLPAEAARIETLRRTLLDLFKVHGYQYVIPPMLEYMESLTTGAGHDLDLHNLQYFAQNIPRLLEVSIGHALICDALYLGLENIISQF